MTWLRLANSAVGVVVALLAATAAGADTASAAAYSPPPANGTFDLQLGGSYSPDPAVGIVDRDRTSHPAPGVYNICYVNAFQTQDYQAAWWKRRHSKLLLHDKSGALVGDTN